jgi:hypothetical protein
MISGIDPGPGAHSKGIVADEEDGSEWQAPSSGMEPGL